MLGVTNYWHLEVISVILGLISVFHYFMTSTYNYWEKRNIPYGKPTFIFGSFYDVFTFKRNPGQVFTDFYRSTNEKLYGFFIFRRPYVVVRDPELIKSILVKDFQHFSNRSGGVNKTDIVGTGNLFTLKNPHWKFLRTKLTPVFTSGKMKQMFPLIVKIGEQLNEYLRKQLKTGSTEEVKEYCAKYTTDVLVSTSFGIEANSLADEKSEFRNIGRTLFTYTMRRSWELTCFFFAPAIAKILNFQLFSNNGTKFLRDIFWGTVKLREETKVRRPDIIDALIQLKNTGSAGVEENNWKENEAAEIKFEGDYLVAQMGVFFTAGFETSSGAMSFTLYHLALNMDIQKRLRSEIITVMENQRGSLEYDDIQKMPYLDCCVKETLRMYPTLPFLDRECTIPYEFPGTKVNVDIGTVVIVALDGLHRDPEYFKEPNTYDPERWNEENKSNIIPYTYLPFGEGPHNCIGARFGALSTKVGIINILKDFEVLPCEKTPIPIEFDPRGFLKSAKGGIYLNMRKTS